MQAIIGVIVCVATFLEVSLETQQGAPETTNNIGHIGPAMTNK